MPSCHACGSELARGERIGRRQTCPRCGADLHCCRNCRFYAPGRHNDCAETQAERVVDKARSNFCEYFALGEGAGSPAQQRPPALRRLEDLFKKRAE